MGYFTRADLPFYYALADAFTICDAYHCSIWGQTCPNRLFLFSGTSGLSTGDDSRNVVANPPAEPNETADPQNDSKTFAALTWPTYAERLQAAGVSWRVYQSSTTTATTAWPISPTSGAWRQTTCSISKAAPGSPAQTPPTPRPRTAST
jgi:phospholipase C